MPTVIIHLMTFYYLYPCIEPLLRIIILCYTKVILYRGCYCIYTFLSKFSTGCRYIFFFGGGSKKNFAPSSFWACYGAARCLIESRIIESTYFNQIFLCLIIPKQYSKMLVNWIIQLMLSHLCWPMRLY